MSHCMALKRELKFCYLLHIEKQFPCELELQTPSAGPFPCVSAADFAERRIEEENR